MQQIVTAATINRDPAEAEISTVRDTESSGGPERECVVIIMRIINVSECKHKHYYQRCCTCTCVTEFTDVQMLCLVADGIVEHTAVGVVILIFHLQR